MATAPFTSLTIAWGGGLDSPYLFNARARAVMAAGMLLALATVYRRDLIRHRRTLLANRGLLWPAGTLSLLLNGMDSGLYAHTAAYVDLSTAYILMNSHPIALIVLTAWLDRGTGRTALNPKTTLILALACTGGVAALTAAEAGGFANMATGKLWPDLPTGYTPALAALISVAVTAVAIQWAWQAGTVLSAQTSGEISQRRAAGLATGESLSNSQALWGFFITGLLVQTPSSVTWHSALLLTDRININALLYLISPATLALQWATGLMNVPRPEYAWAGAAIILSANAAAAALNHRR